ncbi:hypothetical protein [Halomonas alimentaria]|uniref:Uncharacterized protein n=1 Tax=Halomonas alimentaria TaxID=147248 RepID=A0A7X5AQI4_9GAMM|nr:hypothetical protein [Halomonas alimentaria]NAW35013.1 hypothetical protein [Halomonas alimentaria]
MTHPALAPWKKVIALRTRLLRDLATHPQTSLSEADTELLRETVSDLENISEEMEHTEFSGEVIKHRWHPIDGGYQLEVVVDGRTLPPSEMYVIVAWSSELKTWVVADKYSSYEYFQVHKAKTLLSRKARHLANLKVAELHKSGPPRKLPVCVE